MPDFISTLKNLWWRLDRALDEESLYYSGLICSLEAIRSGAKGGKAFSTRVSEYLRERDLFGAQEDPFSILTERELDVLHELAQGLSNKQIASVLNISEQTVKVHIRNLLRKLNVRSRVAATILFLQTRGMQ